MPSKITFCVFGAKERRFSRKKGRKKERKKERRSKRKGEELIDAKCLNRRDLNPCRDE